MGKPIIGGKRLGPGSDGKATGPEVAKANKWQLLLQAQTRTSSARLMLAGKQATTTGVRQGNGPRYHSDAGALRVGNALLLSLQGCVSLFVSGKSSKTRA